MKYDFGDWVIVSLMSLLVIIALSVMGGLVCMCVDDISTHNRLEEQGYAVVRSYGNGKIVMKDGNVYLYKSGQFVQLKELPTINNSGTVLTPVPIIIH
jgi:hypothetical protein